MTEYEYNQAYIKNISQMEEDSILSFTENIKKWAIDNKLKYVALLNNEKRYYTMFVLHENNNNSCNKFRLEVLECIKNIGIAVQDINFVESESAFEFWIKDSDNNVNVYYLFNYEKGVIEIG